MSTDNETLFLVLKQFTRGGKTSIVGPAKVARKEAREYAAVQRKKTKRYTYKIMPASWA